MAVVRKKSGGGCCLFKLFLVLVIIAAILVAAVIGALYMVQSSAAKYASTKRLELKYPASSPELKAGAEAKWEHLKAGTTPPGADKVLFTDAELNSLVSTHPELAMLKNRAFFKIKEDKATVVVSLPLSSRAWAGNGDPEGTAYINAVAEVVPVDPAVAKGYLHLRVASMKFQSKSVTPQQAAQWLSGMNAYLAQLSDSLATMKPNAYATIEGDSLAIKQSGAPSTTSTPKVELGPDGEAKPEQLIDILRTTDSEP